jgi:hypothetical protein
VSAIPPAELGVALARHFLHRGEGDESLSALLRAAATNEAAATRMRELFGAQLLPVAAAACPDPAEAPRRAGLVASQMLGLALCRFVLRLPPVVSLPAEEAAAWIGPTIQRYLTAPSPD